MNIPSCVSSGSRGTREPSTHPVKQMATKGGLIDFMFLAPPPNRPLDQLLCSIKFVPSAKSLSFIYSFQFFQLKLLTSFQTFTYSLSKECRSITILRHSLVYLVKHYCCINQPWGLCNLIFYVALCPVDSKCVSTTLFLKTKGSKNDITKISILITICALPRKP